MTLKQLFFETNAKIARSESDPWSLIRLSYTSLLTMSPNLDIFTF